MRRWGAGFVVVALTACGHEGTKGDAGDLHRAEAPRGDVVPFRTSIDERSMTHVRMRQVHHGLPVVGGEYTAHYDAAGHLVSSRQHCIDRLDQVDTSPRITKEAAIATSHDARGGRIHDARLVVMKPRRAADAILAWEVTLRGDTDDYRIDVDAHTGLVAQTTSLRMQEHGSGKGVFGAARAVEYTRDHGENVMVDQTRQDTFIVAYDAKHSTSLSHADVFTSPDGMSWDTNGAAAGAAVDAAYHVGVAIDFFQNELGRKGWKNREADIELMVHYGKDFANAQYSPYDETINFGDGGDSQYPLAAFLDIVAHEYTHGVTANTSDLDYGGQSGALNEALSDIFGAIIEHSVHPDDHDNWLHGEGSLKDSTRTDGADRDFANPHDSVPPQPAHLDELVVTDDDNGGVHANSGIINQAAYLMTMGGTNGVSKITVKNGIGWTKLAKLLYKVNTDYLDQTSDFADAAGATLDAARDLQFSSAETRTIECAWQAVGLLSGKCEQTEYSLSDGDDDSQVDEPGAGPNAKAPSAEAPQDDDAAAASPSCATSAPGVGGNSWLYVSLGLVLLARAARSRRVSNLRSRMARSRSSIRRARSR